MENGTYAYWLAHRSTRADKIGLLVERAVVSSTLAAILFGLWSWVVSKRRPKHPRTPAILVFLVLFMVSHAYVATAFVRFALDEDGFGGH